MKQRKKIAIVKTRYGSFSCVFESETDMGGYAVTVPKFQGAVSWGKNLTEAKRMIGEAIEGVIESNALARAEKAGTIRFTNRAPSGVA